MQSQCDCAGWLGGEERAGRCTSRGGKREREEGEGRERREKRERGGRKENRTRGTTLLGGGREEEERGWVIKDMKVIGYEGSIQGMV